MTDPRPWEIWRAQWYRDDERQEPDKVRPVVVLGSVPAGYLCMKITTRPKPSLPQLALRPADPGFVNTALAEESYVMPLDRLTLALSDFRGALPLGVLDETYQEQLKALFRRLR